MQMSVFLLQKGGCGQSCTVPALLRPAPPCLSIPAASHSEPNALLLRLSTPPPLPPPPGFIDVANVQGGIHAYSIGVDPNVPTY
jgi:hypothetical protein